MILRKEARDLNVEKDCGEERPLILLLSRNLKALNERWRSIQIKSDQKGRFIALSAACENLDIFQLVHRTLVKWKSTRE